MLGWSRLGSDCNWDAYPIEVSLDVLDNLVAKAGLSERVALLKIDVEGHEPQVLRGCVQYTGRTRSVVLYEALSNESARAPSFCVLLDTIISWCFLGL